MGGTIYALAGGKGGVGRTTTAVNTGIALEKAGYNTVVVDGDVAMTGATKMLGIEAESGVHGILSGTDSINDAVADGPAGLTFVSGDPSLEAFADLDDAKLGRVVEPLAAAHDVVLVDTPPGLQPLHRDAYERADGTILVTTPDDAAVAGTEKAARVVDHVGGSIVGAVVTRADEQAAGEVVDQLDVPPLAVVPESERARQDPVVVGEDDPAAAALEGLAETIGQHAESGSIDTVDLPDPAEQAQQEEVASLFEEVKPDDVPAEQAGTLTRIKERLEQERDLGEGAAKTGTLAVVTERLKQEDELEDVTVEGDDDALNALFEDDYGSDGAEGDNALEEFANRIDDGEVGDRLNRLSERVNADALRERLEQDDGDAGAGAGDRTGNSGAGADGAEESDGSGGALGGLSKKVSDVGNTDSLRDRFGGEDEVDDIDVDDDEDALDALFTEDDE